jgi:hypothetical protein
MPYLLFALLFIGGCQMAYTELPRERPRGPLPQPALDCSQAPLQPRCVHQATGD